MSGNVDINCDSFQKNACEFQKKNSAFVFVFAHCDQALKPCSHLASMSTFSSAALTVRLITVRIRSSQEDNIFSHVCQSVQGAFHVTTTYDAIGQSQAPLPHGPAQIYSFGTPLPPHGDPCYICSPYIYWVVGLRLKSFLVIQVNRAADLP